MAYAIHEKVLLFTHALAARAGKTVAVWFDGTAIQKVAVNSCSGTHHARTALVNLIRNGNIGRGGFICLSSAPGEIDRGIFQMNPCRKGLYWVAGSTVHCAKAPNFGWTDATVTASSEFATWLAKTATNRTTDATNWCKRNTTGSNSVQFSVLPAATSISVDSMFGHLIQHATPPRLVAVPEGTPLTGYTATELTDAILLALAYAIVRVGWSEGRETDDDDDLVSDGGEFGGHNIGCVIVDGDGAIIGWGLNMNAVSVTFHGEVNALLNYQRDHAGALPASTRFYTTLKPCHMCAGTIVTAGSNVTVLVGQDDANIKNSALDRRVNGCSETNLGDAVGRQLSAIQGEQSTTGSLTTEEAKELFEGALYQYFLFGVTPMTGAPLVIWRQGLELLKKISPTVSAVHGYWRRGMQELMKPPVVAPTIAAPTTVAPTTIVASTTTSASASASSPAPPASSPPPTTTTATVRQPMNWAARVGSKTT
ncbi:MAG TPA: Bd3614 family nucleic acid deaminase [Thermoanaerobaculia bacterium]|nr:Bd3614 family nucleic acid deaminase [Thermoanaerobaculia bacterium]